MATIRTLLLAPRLVNEPLAGGFTPWCTLAPLRAENLTELRTSLLNRHRVAFPIGTSWLTPRPGESLLPLLDPYEIPEPFLHSTARPVWTPTVACRRFPLRRDPLLSGFSMTFKQPELGGGSFEVPGLLIINEGLELLRPFLMKETFVLNSLLRVIRRRPWRSVAGFRECFFRRVINSQEMAYWWRRSSIPRITNHAPRRFGILLSPPVDRCIPAPP
jgi:hypothetical protein